MSRAIAGRRRACQAGAHGRRPAGCGRRALLLLMELWPALLCRAQTAATQNAGTGTPLTAQRYAINVTIDPEKYTLKARTDVTFVCGSDSSSLELYLNPHLRINTVRDAGEKPLVWARSTRVGSPKFSVQLNRPCAAGSPVQLQFDYEGTIFPARPFYPAFNYHFLRDDDLWYPQADAFDFAESDVTLRVPAYCETLTSGTLVDRHREEKVAIYHWKSPHPVNGRSIAVYSRPQHPSVVREVNIAAPLAGVPAGSPPLRVEEICPDALTTLREASPCGELARRAVPILQKFAAMLGPPPESSLTILPLNDSLEAVAGYSAPGMLIVSDWAARFAGESVYFPSFLAHEIAHQWFPNGVAPASAADGWLAESLAEYLAWRYLRETDPEAARAMVEEAMRDAVSYTPARPLSLGLDLLAGPLSERGAQAILYQRGMLVFRTLETAIDRERVDRALAEFYKRYCGRKASIVDFRAACEQIAGRNLSWFFNYFIEGTQIPTIELRRLPSESPGVAAGEIVVKDFPPEGSVRVEMAIRTAQGIVEHSVATRGAVTPFTANIPAPALSITLDPDLRILRWTEAAECSKAQTAILAALPREITPKDLPATMELYRHALAADPEDASRRAQALHESLGELEREGEQWSAALADFEAAINGHSISPYETYRVRAEAYLHHGELQLHDNRPKEALEDAQAGLALPRVVLQAYVPAGLPGSSATRTLQQALESLRDAASCR